MGQHGKRRWVAGLGVEGFFVDTLRNDRAAV